MNIPTEHIAIMFAVSTALTMAFGMSIAKLNIDKLRVILMNSLIKSVIMIAWIIALGAGMITAYEYASGQSFGFGRSETPPQAPSSGVNWASVPPDVARWEDEIIEAADECGVDPALLAALVNQESRGDATICSKAGACGLTQLMPATAKQMGVTDRSDPDQNLRGGACYLKLQLDRYDDMTVALAAYNAGPGNVNKYGGVPPFPETQKYVKLVPAFYEAYRAKGAGLQMAAFDDAAGEPVALVKNESQICCGWPVENVRITSQPTRNHTALDLGGWVGAPILAAHSGEVVTVATRTDYGRYVIIENGDIRTLYAHLESAKVKVGQQVKRGSVIGGMGATGNTRGVHLHFETYQGGKIVNPLSFLPLK